MRLVAIALVFGLVACKSLFPAYDEVNDPTDDVTLAKCRAEGRAARDAGSSAHRAYDVYEDCKVDGGLR